ncbi:N-alpha-acetyltransferase 25, NatB auxiliary subunit [Blyttiomyces sp. JEL0837]|nr:N-alpha-acetyltransferase 25, NatB auxiliary subunit [Blyttiomyces sp. JEL0837]
MSMLNDPKVLNGILEAIEVANYKQGLALCLKAMKKNPDALNLKALKAFCLDKQGKELEALELCLEILKRPPNDDLTLQVVSNVFRARAKYPEITRLYEGAYALDPSNEEYANHVFMSMVRNKDLRSQQQLAMKMQKTFKSNKYYFWAVMVLYLQGLAPQDATKKNICFSLAEKMMQKAVEDRRFSTFEELQLYLLILEQQGKRQEALQIINGDLGKLCKVATERQRLAKQIVRASGDFATLETLAKDSLEASLDDWESYTEYLDAIVNTSKNLDEARDFIKNLQQKSLETSQTKPVRGPFVAEIELFHRFKDPEDLIKSIIAYFGKFSSNLSAFDDIKNFLGMIPDDLITNTLSQLQSIVDASEKDIISKVRQSVNFQKIRFFLLSRNPDDDLQTVTTGLKDQYDLTVNMSANLAVTERRYGDDFIILTVLSLIAKYAQSGNVSDLLEPASLLEFGLDKSPSNFTMKLLLLRIYKKLGSHKGVVRLTGSLDIKQIMFDTLSFLYSEGAEYFTPAELSIYLFQRILTIHASNNRETPEMIIQAFKFGTYSKIQEFMDFQERLHSSLQRGIATRQISRLEVLRRMSDDVSLSAYLLNLDSSLLTYSDEAINALRDNRDFTVDVKWFGDESTAFEKIEKFTSKENMSYWLRLHALLPLIMREISVDQKASGDFVEPLTKTVELGKAQDGPVHVGADIILQLYEVASPVKANGSNEAQLGISDLDQCLKRFEGLLDELNSVWEALAPENFSDSLLKRAFELIETIGYICKILPKAVSNVSKEKKKEGKDFINNARKRIVASLEKLKTLIEAWKVKAVISSGRIQVVNPNIAPWVVDNKTWTKMIDEVNSSRTMYCDYLVGVVKDLAKGANRL